MKWPLVASLLTITACSDSGGDNSQTAGQLANDPDPTPGLVINRDNHTEIVSEIFQVYTGGAIDSLFYSVPTRREQFGPAIGSATIPTFSCDNGGTVSYILIDEYGAISNSYVYADCQIGTMTMDGEYHVLEADEETAYSSPGGLSIETAAGDTLSFQGEAAFSCCLSSLFYVRENAFSYQYSSADSSLEITDATVQFSDGDYFISGTRKAAMTGDFQIRLSDIGDHQLTVEIIEDFIFESAADLSYSETQELARNWTFSQGLMKVVAADGSELVLDADSGDQSTANITIKNATGSESFDQPWSLWSAILTRME